MTSTPAAYAVPFWIDRTAAPRLYRVMNIGDEVVRGLRVSLVGSGVILPISAPLLAPGMGVTLTTLGPDLSRDGIAVVRWFRPNDEEYLWRFSF